MWNKKLMSMILIISFLGIAACTNNQSNKQSLNSKTSLNGWIARNDMEGKNLWTIGKAKLDPKDATQFVITPDGDEMVNTGQGGVDIYTKEKYGDIHIELEFMLPVDGNTGVYLMGEYEVQIWDSYNKPVILANQWMGTITATKEPEIHAEKAGGEWQTLEVDFKSPRFDKKGNKISNAKFVKVVLNGYTIHENVEVNAPTPVCLTGKESEKGPVMFQGFTGPSAYRNIKFIPIEIE